MPFHIIFLTCRNYHHAQRDFWCWPWLLSRRLFCSQVPKPYQYLRSVDKHTPDALITAQFIVMGPSIESLIVLTYAGNVSEWEIWHLLAHPDNNVEGIEPQYRCWPIVLAYARDMLEWDMHLLAYRDNNAEGSELQYRCWSRPSPKCKWPYITVPLRTDGANQWLSRYLHLVPQICGLVPQFY